MIHVWMPDTGRAALTGDMSIEGLAVDRSFGASPYLSTVYSEIWNLKPKPGESGGFVVLDPERVPQPS